MQCSVYFNKNPNCVYFWLLVTTPLNGLARNSVLNRLHLMRKRNSLAEKYLNVNIWDGHRNKKKHNDISVIYVVFHVSLSRTLLQHCSSSHSMRYIWFCYQEFHNENCHWVKNMSSIWALNSQLLFHGLFLFLFLFSINSETIFRGIT